MPAQNNDSVDPRAVGLLTHEGVLLVASHNLAMWCLIKNTRVSSRTDKDFDNLMKL